MARIRVRQIKEAQRGLFLRQAIMSEQIPDEVYSNLVESEFYAGPDVLVIKIDEASKALLLRLFIEGKHGGQLYEFVRQAGIQCQTIDVFPAWIEAEKVYSD